MVVLVVELDDPVPPSDRDGATPVEGLAASPPRATPPADVMLHEAVASDQQNVTPILLNKRRNAT